MKRIGIKQLSALNNPNLKRDILFVDELWIDKGNYEIFKINDQYTKQLTMSKVDFDIDYLTKNGLLKIYDSVEYMNTELMQSVEKHDFKGISRITEVFENVLAALAYRNDLHDKIHSKKIKGLANFTNTLDDYHALSTRISSIMISLLKYEDSIIPIITDFQNIGEIKNSRKEEILAITMNKIPVIDNSISWEQIMEFKSDSEIQKKFLALKDWIVEMTYSILSTSEIEEKLEYLLQDYESHIRLHRAKFEYSTMEIIVKTTLDTLENVFKLNFGKIADSFFSFKHSKINLLEAEYSAPGKQLAYLSAINKIL